MARIAIVLNNSWNIYNFRMPLLNRLKELGHEILVIAPEDEYTCKIPFEFYPISIKSRSVNPGSELLVFLNFCKVYLQAKPDILLLYTIKPNVYGNFAAFLFGIKSISNIAGLGSLFINPGFATKVAKFLYWLALKVPSKVFFQNNEDMGIFIREGLVTKNIADRIPGSGIDLNRFIPGSGVAKGSLSKKFVFLLLSRMLWDKGIGEYVDAAKQLMQKIDNVEFQLLGFLDADNPSAISQEDMDNFTANEGIVYLGVSDQVEEVISQSDCVILPSYKEGLPRALLEAAALSKPIIATDVSGCRDVVEHGITGFLCKSRDSADLSEKMEAMVRLSDTERATMGASGRKKIEQEFDQTIVIQKYVDVIDGIA